MKFFWTFKDEKIDAMDKLLRVQRDVISDLTALVCANACASGMDIESVCQCCGGETGRYLRAVYPFVQKKYAIFAAEAEQGREQPCPN